MFLCYTNFFFKIRTYIYTPKDLYIRKIKIIIWGDNITEEKPLDSETYKRDSEIIKQALLPAISEISEKEVDVRSLAIFLSHYLKELLKEVSTQVDKEKIIRRLLD